MCIRDRYMGLLPVSFRKGKAKTQREPLGSLFGTIEVERLRANLRRLGSSPRALIFLVGVSGVSALLAALDTGRGANAKKEIIFRKEQLSKPLYELSQEESVHPPWTDGRINEWLFRRVRITGRPDHSQAMLVPRWVNGYFGYDYIVPLITRETEDGSKTWGLLLNKGWIPHEYEHPGSRYRIEDSSPQTFEGYVTRNEDLSRQSAFDGNSPTKGRNRWTHVDLHDMARFTGFQNQEAVAHGIIECADLQYPLNENDVKHYEFDVSMRQTYPYRKTSAGALQVPGAMPGDISSRVKGYLSLSIATGLLGLAAKIA
eukprot:TRINITY_DN8039_c0_g4_i1.p1 TRINITY_DN8039_c0_g4~~TRINITY_DN8039_c0_g4_i1.p1  ORF type:complete len:335 (+),score=89.52 TRINITY_DN8039_c0_g4_i1:62-1006(+)